MLAAVCSLHYHKTRLWVASAWVWQHPSLVYSSIFPVPSISFSEDAGRTIPSALALNRAMSRRYVVFLSKCCYVNKDSSHVLCLKCSHLFASSCAPNVLRWYVEFEIGRIKMAGARIRKIVMFYLRVQGITTSILTIYLSTLYWLSYCSSLDHRSVNKTYDHQSWNKILEEMSWGGKIVSQFHIHKEHTYTCGCIHINLFLPVRITLYFTMNMGVRQRKAAEVDIEKEESQWEVGLKSPDPTEDLSWIYKYVCDEWTTNWFSPQ